MKTILRRIFSSIGPLQIAILVLVIATAVIHLQHGLAMGGGPGGGGRFSGGPPAGFSGNPPAGFSGTPSSGSSGAPSSSAAGAPPGGAGGFSLLANLPIPLSTLFILNFIGYLVLGLALYLRPLQRIQRLIRWLLIAFTAVTIAAWFLIASAHPDTLGVVDKVIEGALILLLLIEELRSFKKRPEPHESPVGENTLQFTSKT